MDVIDGDTFDLADGTRVRLAIVDTPEVHPTTEPCGPEASEFTAAFLAGATVAVFRPTDAPSTGGFDRLLGEVVRVSDGASLNVALVDAGLGRIDERFVDEDPDLTARLRRAAEDAATPDCAAPDGDGGRSSDTQDSGDGSATSDASATGDGPVTISHVQYDAPGNDVEYGDSEYVELRNEGDQHVDLSGWQIADDDGNGVTIPDGYGIAPGGTFTVHTGPGDNDPASDRYHAGQQQGYLNNSGGDLVQLLDASGVTVATFRYES